MVDGSSFSDEIIRNVEEAKRTFQGYIDRKLTSFDHNKRPRNRRRNDNKTCRDDDGVASSYAYHRRPSPRRFHRLCHRHRR